MHVRLFYDNENEYFDNGETIIYHPIGSAFIEFIELDSLRNYTNHGFEKNPFFKLFKSVYKLKDNIVKISEAISYYKAASEFILSSEIEEFKDLTAKTRYCLFTHFISKDIAETSVISTFMWVPLEGSKGIDTSKINFENKELCSETYEGLKNSVKDCSIGVTQIYTVNDIFEALNISFMHMIMNNIQLKKCKYCNKYFVPTGRSDTEYCNRIAPNSNKTCNEVGAIKKYHEKSKNNPILQVFQKEYKKNNARVRIKKITKNQFYEWSTNARILRDKAMKENMDIDEFKKQLGSLEV